MPSAPSRLWQPEDDWTPYGRWAYGKATPEDDHLRVTDPDAFWPDMLIGDQFLNPEQRAECREHMGIPPIPIRQQGGLSGSQPRCSSHDRRPVIHPDNVYGSRNPTQSEQMSNRDFGRIIRGVPAPSKAPGNRPNSPLSEGKGKQHADSLVQNMVQEGGAGLIKFLLRAAVSSTDAKGSIPDVSKVREWQYRDLMCLPKAVQEEWKTACKEELEALHRRNIFKLTDLPKGRKTIGCRWVFDVKSDG